MRRRRGSRRPLRGRGARTSPSVPDHRSDLDTSSAPRHLTPQNRRHKALQVTRSEHERLWPTVSDGPYDFDASAHKVSLPASERADHPTRARPFGIWSPTASHVGGYASRHDCRVGCDQQTAEDACRRSRGAWHPGFDCQTAWPGSRSPPGPSGVADACGPGSPGSRPGGLGPHLASSGFLGGLSSGFPFARRVLPLCPPSLVPLGPAFSGSFPSAAARFRFSFGSPPGSLPLSNIHASAAAERFRRRWSRAAGTKVISPVATPPIARSPRAAGGQRPAP